MAKPIRLPERPKPPQFSQIRDDIENANDDDVVFSIGNKTLSQTLGSTVSASVTMEESFLDLSPSEEKNNTSLLNQSKLDDEPNVTYEKANELITLHKKLQEGPVLMQEQYKKLELLGDDVSESIEKLKKSAEAFISKKKLLT